MFHMERHLSFSNWSVSKLLDSEPDSLNRARIRIIFTILSFSILKILIVIPVALMNEQHIQYDRMWIMLLVSLSVIKLQLSGTRYTAATAHLTVITGLVFIWTNSMFVINSINIPTMQFIFMVILMSFYLHGRKLGILYSILSVIPVLLLMLMGNDIRVLSNGENELASPGFEIIIILNFCTLIISHYFYHEAFTANVAEKENLNKQLTLAVERANRAAQSKSDFLSTMSHELRTPLNSVIGMSELLKANPYDKEQLENVKILNFSAQNLRSLINDILDYNKLGSEKLNLESISLDLHQLISDVCAGFKYPAEAKGLQLILEIAPELKQVHVITDPTRITQVINNLVGNAIKFTSEGIVYVEVQILSRSEEKIATRFSVIDTGIGISEEKQSLIFEPFTQASTSTTREYGGTGLGLAIVKRLLHLFDSNIYLESSNATGSKFYFDISFLIGEKSPAGEEANTDKGMLLQGLRVLVAEDNPMNRMLLKKLFSQWECESAFAENGQVALDLLANDHFDVILMDIHMPVLDGYETARNVRKITNKRISSTPIIALTASVSNDLNAKVLEAGMNDFIHKPFHARDLFLKLRIIHNKISDSGRKLAETLID